MQSTDAQPSRNLFFLLFLFVCGFYIYMLSSKTAFYIHLQYNLKQIYQLSFSIKTYF